MVAREALSRAPGPEKVLDKFEFPPPPAKPKRAPFTPTRIAPSWGCRDSSTRSVWCFTESMCGRDSELVNSRCRAHPGTLSPPRSFLLQGKADTRWFLSTNLPKAGDRAILRMPPRLEMPVYRGLQPPRSHHQTSEDSHQAGSVCRVPGTVLALPRLIAFPF